MRGLISWLSLIGLVAAQEANSTNTSPYSPSEFGSDPVKLIVFTATDSGYVYDAVPLTPQAYNRLPVR